MKMEHVMIDLETLGRRAGCSILSIGAVAFDPKTKQLGKELYVVVNRQSCNAAELHEDLETLDWWNKQSEAAKTVLTEATMGGVQLAAALDQLTEYLAPVRPQEGQGLGQRFGLRQRDPDWLLCRHRPEHPLGLLEQSLLPYPEEPAASSQAGSPRYLPQRAR
jgi:hypothetical protein